METNGLTLIACSGSLIAATLFATLSQAMPIQDFGDGTPKLDRTTPDRSMQTEDRATPGSDRQRLEQAAFTRFGCSCANCISATAKLVQTGEISL